MEDLDLEELPAGTSPLCFHCAQRLGRCTWPEIPELLFGQCPQCGGTRPLAPVETRPHAKTGIARKQRAA
jgi:hypothetical protein